MIALARAVRRCLRGPAVSALLERLGIDPRRYWLLMDLFGQLSERRELFSQLGRDALTLRKASWAYYILSGLMALLFILAKPSPIAYFSGFLAFTVFLLVAILLSETSNSLVNPVEALVLAHQPIDGATYTAAKLTHLLRILLHLVPGLTLFPALAGFALKGCLWFYPLLFLLTAFALGLLVALSCCAIFGWLIRLVPPSRLKAVGMIAEALPWLVFLLFQFGRQLRVGMNFARWLPVAHGPRALLAAALGAVVLALGISGIRALSGDYLVRVAAIAHGSSRTRSKTRRSRLSDLVARLAGGPPARAGFEYLSRMMARDWQFRRQLLQVVPMLMIFAPVFQGPRISPFSGKFTAMHLLPHAFGLAFYTICSVIVYGTDHQGVWLFLLAPAGAFRGLARGIYARLLTLIVVPHMLLLPILAWAWGIRDATLFAAYSMTVAAVYLSLELRLIDGLPFSRQPESTQNLFALPVMFLGGAVIAVAVGLQYFLVFRSPAAVVAVTLALGGVAWFLTRASLGTFETAIRFRLETFSSPGKALYTEIET